MPFAMRVFLVSLLFAVSLCAGVCAQTTKRLSREAIDSLINPKLVCEKERMLFFDSTQHNMGVIYESDAPRKISFYYVNRGDKAVRITKVTTNCGCTASAFSEKDIMPGDTGAVVVEYNPRRRSGTVDTNALVYTNLSGTKPVVKLTVLGNVIDKDEWGHLPHHMGCLRLKRRVVPFEKPERGQLSEQRIPCVNVGTRAVTLSSRLLPSYITLVTEPQEIEPGDEADIVITVNGKELPAKVPDSFNIVVEGVEGRISDRTIKVVFENKK